MILHMVRALRQHTDAIFRVDANAAWDLETAMQLIPQLKDLGVELVEQPLAKDDWEGMKKLFKSSPFHCMLMNPVCRKRMLKNARIIFMVSI